MTLHAYLSGRAHWASSFQYRNFRLLWASTLLFALGFGMDLVVLSWLVFEMTDSPFMLTVTFAARIVPFFFLGIISGAIADRVDRRVFLRFISLGGSATSAVMAVVLLLDIAHVFQIIALTAVTGCFFAFLQTVRNAYTYDIVSPERALNAISLSSVSQRVGSIGGAIAAGAIISTLGPGNQYLAIAACYLASAGILMGTRDVGQGALAEGQSVLGNLIGGLQLLRRNRILVLIMLVTTITELFGWIHLTLLPVFAKEVLGVGAVSLGFMNAFAWGGGLIAMMVLANLGDFRRKGLLMVGAMSAAGLGHMTLALPLAANFFFFLAVLAFVNGCVSTVDTLDRTLMQANVANEERGRAMGAWVLCLGVGPLGHLGAGGLAGAIGAQGTVLIYGLALAVAGIASAIGLPRVRRLE